MGFFLSVLCMSWEYVSIFRIWLCLLVVIYFNKILFSPQNLQKALGFAPNRASAQGGGFFTPPTPSKWLKVENADDMFVFLLLRFPHCRVFLRVFFVMDLFTPYYLFLLATVLYCALDACNKKNHFSPQKADLFQKMFPFPLVVWSLFILRTHSCTLSYSSSSYRSA